MILYYSDVLDKTSESKEELIKEETAVIAKKEAEEKEKNDLIEAINKCMNDIAKYEEALSDARKIKRNLVEEFEEKYAESKTPPKSVFNDLDDIFRFWFE